MAITVLTTTLLSCSPGRKTPEAAFEQLRVVIQLDDRSRLYGVLDTESRWALDSVYKTQREIAVLVEQFPEPARARELARVVVARDSVTAEAFLARTARFGDVFGSLRGPAGKIGRRKRVVNKGDGQVDVVTDTGVVVPMARGPEGLWGYARLRADLVFWRDAAANDLLRLKEDATLYRDKR